jgi:hypothetical protein
MKKIHLPPGIGTQENPINVNVFALWKAWRMLKKLIKKWRRDNVLEEDSKLVQTRSDGRK